MSCCAPGAEAALLDRPDRSVVEPGERNPLLASRDLGDGARQTDLSVPGIHCAACIASVERTLSALPGVEFARVNLSMKRAAVRWRAIEGAARSDRRAAGCRLRCAPVHERVRFARSGICAAHPGARGRGVLRDEHHAPVGIRLGGSRRRDAAGIPLDFGGTCPALRSSIPDGSSFHRRGRRCVTGGPTWMCRSRSVCCMAFGLSLYDTLHNGPHAYFDAATSLLFFLLIGRTLDHVMREKARSAVAGLARLAPHGATVRRRRRPAALRADWRDRARRVHTRCRWRPDSRRRGGDGRRFRARLLAGFGRERRPDTPDRARRSRPA